MTLIGLFNEMCRRYPGAMVSLEKEITRHRPIYLKQPGKMETTYSLYISDVLMLEGDSAEDLLEKARVWLDLVDKKLTINEQELAEFMKQVEKEGLGDV